MVGSDAFMGCPIGRSKSKLTSTGSPTSRHTGGLLQTRHLNGWSSVSDETRRDADGGSQSDARDETAEHDEKELGTAFQSSERPNSRHAISNITLSAERNEMSRHLTGGWPAPRAHTPPSPAQKT
ncbi:hypothetical protein GGTG_11166 [Gaeumannomyces tritici R3-111a-1]|uniref:Uncharacterized protein n=1 Tax=Gaeumannomyces tritici (strain R3-111a-1) TaxID=644352 RepID=J3PCE3_GAET3|nr:hypothetical protein GGTG_11166 [Gaeumannomyces tritici R3-111a-1]EJT71913.1 hypothetical protein GGTG_11166 [Gaeumannomyces tritici R3-111a-1]